MESIHIILWLVSASCAIYCVWSADPLITSLTGTYTNTELVLPSSLILAKHVLIGMDQLGRHVQGARRGSDADDEVTAAVNQAAFAAQMKIEFDDIVSSYGKRAALYCPPSSSSSSVVWPYTMVCGISSVKLAYRIAFLRSFDWWLLLCTVLVIVRPLLLLVACIPSFIPPLTLVVLNAPMMVLYLQHGQYLGTYQMAALALAASCQLLSQLLHRSSRVPSSSARPYKDNRYEQ